MEVLLNFPFAGYGAGKQVMMEFNGTREVIRHDQTMMCHGIYPRQKLCAGIHLAGICAWGNWHSYRDLHYAFVSGMPSKVASS